MNHPSNEENEVVGLALGSNSCNVEEHVYWPGKTILKLYLVSWTLSACLETIEYNHMLYVCGRTIKNNGLAVATVCAVKQAVF